MDARRACAGLSLAALCFRVCNDDGLCCVVHLRDVLASPSASFLDAVHHSHECMHVRLLTSPHDVAFLYDDLSSQATGAPIFLVPDFLSEHEDRGTGVWCPMHSLLPMML